MPQSGIHAAPVANPDFVGLRNRAVGIVAHERELAFELGRRPQIVGIKERYQRRARHLDAAVPRRRRTAMLDALDSDRFIEACQMFDSSIGRAVVDDDQLELA